jgi:hypothetical protein
MRATAEKCSSKQTEKQEVNSLEKQPEKREVNSLEKQRHEVQ